MSQATLIVRPELGSGDDTTPIGTNQRVDLSSRRDRRYIFPEPIKEFEGRKTITLTIKTEGVPLSVSTSDESVRLLRDDETQIRYERDLRGKGRQGVLKDRITVNLGGLSHHLVILFPVAGEDLNQKQYDLMLEDISHWLHASLRREAEHETKPEARDGDDQSLKADVETFYRIRRHTSRLDSALQRISRSPEEEIKKTYKQTRGDSYRQDARTLRWNEARSGLPESMTYEPTQTFDVYENRFILFLLDQINQILNTIEKSAYKSEQNTKTNLQKLKKLYKEGKRKKWKVEDAEEEHERSVRILEETRDLKNKVQKIKNYPFLRDANYNPSQFKVSSTLTLTQNIDYSRVFSIYQ